MNKVKYGLRNVVYAPVTIANNDYTYGTPVAIPGAVNLTLAGVGEATDMYADDSIYFQINANQGYEGELEVALLPDSFHKDILGIEEDGNGALVENADAVAKGFALGFEVQGDTSGRKTWLYHVTATRPNGDASTKEASITPLTDKLSIKAIPRTSDKNVKVVMTKTVTNEDAYDSFFTEVYEEVTPSA